MNRLFYNKPALLSLLLLLGFISPPLKAQPVKVQQNQDKLPSLALLQYLANMTELDGQLYGPQDMPACSTSPLDKRDRQTELDKDEYPKMNKPKQKAIDPECQYNE
jgi:hypothetical protein